MSDEHAKENADGTPETDIAEGSPPETPTSMDEADDLERIKFTLQGPSAMEVFFAWEKPRVVYNIMLIVFIWSFAVISAPPGGRLDWKKLFGLLFVFNVCLCVGPVGEGYLCYFHVPRQVARWVAFFLGTAGSVLAMELWRIS